jgi:ABC-type uncharacterized transport system substrate-binding protein
MRRREFIALLCGGVAGWPLGANAQHPEKVPTIGLLGSTTALFESQRVAAFVQRLRQLGWIENRNVAIEYRWAEGRAERFAEIAAEFVQLKVDLIVAPTTPAVKVELVAVDVREEGSIERGLAAFASVPNCGLIVAANPGATMHIDLIVALAARYRLPAVYPYRFFATSGGLISYGSDNLAEWRRAASYVDRVLKGENPADLPVQQPTKYELVINLKTARALGLDLPAMLLARADEVIE